MAISHTSHTPVVSSCLTCSGQGTLYELRTDPTFGPQDWTRPCPDCKLPKLLQEKLGGLYPLPEVDSPFTHRVKETLWWQHPWTWCAPHIRATLVAALQANWSFEGMSITDERASRVRHGEKSFEPFGTDRPPRLAELVESPDLLILRLGQFSAKPPSDAASAVGEILDVRRSKATWVIGSPEKYNEPESLLALLGEIPLVKP
jgi:hypothetical protein